MSWKCIAMFAVHGTPRPQPRTKSGIRKGKDGRVHSHVYDPGTADGWKMAVAMAAREHLPSEPLEGPVRVDITFRMPRPKSHFGTGRNAGKLKPSAPSWHTQGMGKNGGDRDNLDKATLDALTTLGMWKDDGQVCAGEPTKRYVDPGKRPGAVIKIAVWQEAE